MSEPYHSALPLIDPWSMAAVAVNPPAYLSSTECTLGNVPLHTRPSPVN